MSAEDNIALVQRFYGANGDAAVVDSVMSADVIWDITPGFPYAAVYTGLASVRADFLAPLAKGYAALGARPQQYSTDGATVLVVGHYAATAKSGAAFQARFLHIWTIAESAIVHNFQIADSAVMRDHFQN